MEIITSNVIEAIDVEKFNEDMSNLLAGEEV